MEASTRATDGARWRESVDPAVEDRLAAAIDELAQLPVLDSTVLEILNAVDDPTSSTADLVRVLEADPTFAANLLRYANSASRSHPIRAKSIRQAVMLVGRRALRQLALEAATYRFIEEAPGTAASRGELHVHALGVASAALAGAQRLNIAADEAHLAGLLHDVGKLVLPLAFGEAACDELAREYPGGGERALVERERLGVDHAIAGGLLAERWNLPDGVAEAIALHHGGPSGLASPDPSIAVVQVANELQRLLTNGAPDHALLEAAMDRCDSDAVLLDELARHALPYGSALPEAGALGRRVNDVDHLSETDDVTGAANRRHWLQTTRTALNGAPGAIVVVHVGGLEAIDAEHGERVADTVLSEVARVLGHHGRVGRLGVERFGVLLAHSGAAAAVMSAIDAELTRSLGADGLTPPLTMGAASSPQDGDDLADLLDLAGAQLAIRATAPARLAPSKPAPRHALKAPVHDREPAAGLIV
jgi:putative nucleotidyltransferase with HDIG domain